MVMEQKSLTAAPAKSSRATSWRPLDRQKDGDEVVLVDAVRVEPGSLEPGDLLEETRVAIELQTASDALLDPRLRSSGLADSLQPGGPVEIAEGGIAADLIHVDEGPAGAERSEDSPEQGLFLRVLQVMNGQAGDDEVEALDLREVLESLLDEVDAVRVAGKPLSGEIEHLARGVVEGEPGSGEGGEDPLGEEPDPAPRSTNTSSPRLNSLSARWDPMNPAPPVIKTLINLFLSYTFYIHEPYHGTLVATSLVIKAPIPCE